MSKQDQRGGSILTVPTGRYVFPLDLDPKDIDIEDIAHALSMQCRFIGHVIRFYSVAEHSIHVSRIVEAHTPSSKMLALWALLHDAAEAYLSDVARPIKYSTAFQFYRDIEQDIEKKVAARFGLSPSLAPPVVREVDRWIGQLEAHLLRDHPRPNFEVPEWVTVKSFNCFTPRDAEESFLDHYFRLAGEVKDGK